MMGRWWAPVLALALLGDMTAVCQAQASASGSVPVDSDRGCPKEPLALTVALRADGPRPEVTVDDTTRGQPRGGIVRIVVRNWPGAVYQSAVTVCFRWRHSVGAETPYTAAAMPIRVFPSSGAPASPDTAIFAVRVPDGLGAADKDVQTISLGMAPVAEMLVRINDSTGNQLDTLLAIAVTNNIIAIFGTVLLSFALIAFLWRVKSVGSRNLSGVNVFLRLITGADGRASLSQFQIILWSFVIGGGAIYVMLLTGDLITITTGALVLLGISGGATLSAELNRSNTTAQANNSQPTLPSWSDMVISGGEIDVTRVQMLFFTVITALFVSLEIVVGHVIPEIPDSFQILMGISNGVYVTKKFIPVP